MANFYNTVNFSNNPHTDWIRSIIADYNNLTKEEEVALAERIKNGDVEAINKMAMSMARYALNEAKKRFCFTLEAGDLFSEAFFGLKVAAERYTPEKGRFSTYAAWYVRKFINNAIAELDKSVSESRSLRTLWIQVEKAIDAFVKENGRYASDEELAEIMGISVNDIRDAIEFGCNAVTDEYEDDCNRDDDSDESHCGNWKNVDIHDFEDTLWSSMIDDDMSEAFEKAVMSLPERTREIVCLRFGLFGYEKVSVEEISREMNLSTERLRQIVNDARVEIKRRMSSGKCAA